MNNGQNNFEARAIGAAAKSSDEMHGPGRSILIDQNAARFTAKDSDSQVRVQKRINNNKVPDTRISRDALPGEIKFKQIKLTNRKTNFEVILLVRKQQ